MASGAKYFILNRESDWTDGSILKNLEFEDDKLVFNSQGESGIYMSAPFDSMQRGTIWHRLRMDIDLPNTATCKIRAYASDTPEILLPSLEVGKRPRIDLNEYLSDYSIDTNSKIDLFDYIEAKIYENPKDILLFGLKGRYLWICIEIISYEEEPVSISSMKIEFPQVSFVDYLPEVYRKNSEADSFLSRFIGIFQSMYVDLEDDIDYIALKFDADRTTKDFLSWMSEWLSIKDASVWGEKRLRHLIKESVKIYKMKGTRKAVSKIVQEYAGIEPTIVEQFDIKNNALYEQQKEMVENLFGDNGYVFTVMIPEAYVKDTETYVELMRIINSVKPIDSICNLVVLSDQMRLDHHCYMGINSFITKNEELTLDKKQKDISNLIISQEKDYKGIFK